MECGDNKQWSKIKSTKENYKTVTVAEKNTDFYQKKEVGSGVT